MQGSEETKVLIDTYAWVEYFRGTEEGGIARRYIESDREVMTPTIALAELSDKYRRSGKTQVWESERRHMVEVLSAIVPLSPDSSDQAGAVKTEMRNVQPDFPLADGMILAIARERGAKVLTGDRHIRDLPDAINLKELARSNASGITGQGD